MKNSIPKILRLGFILSMLVLVISASIPYFNFIMLRDSERWVGHTMQVLQAADALRIAVVDAESGQRGYLLTEEANYLDPFSDSQKRIEEQLDSLLALTENHPQQQDDLLAIRTLIQTKLDELKTTIRLQDEGKRAEALQLVNTNRGSVLMTEIRQRLGEFQQVERQLLDDRVNEANTNAQRTLQSFLTITFVNFALFAILYFFIQKNARQRRAAEIALNKQTHLLGSVITNMSEGLYVVDKNGEPLLSNPVMETIYDKNISALKLDEWQNHYHLSNLDGLPFEYEHFPAVQVMNGAQASTAEMIVRWSNSEQVKIIRVSARPLIDDSGIAQGVVCISSDISQHKKSELKLRLAMQQAESSSRAKSDFVANMSHEIRTPLNAIMGTAQILTKTALSSVQNKYVNMIVLSTQSLLTILNDILDFSKIEANKLELAFAPFPLSNVMQQLAAIMSMAAENKNIELIINIDADVPSMLMGDQHRLYQILVNFVSNAIKFTEAGEVTVAVKREAQNDEKITLRFVVTDTGIGISKEQQERLFSPFTQADSSITRKFGGTGLGLTISRRLAELMGGSIHMFSEVGKGSEFSLILPFNIDKNTKDAAQTTAQNTAQKSEMKPLHLLVIDDNAAVRDSIANMISLWHWQADVVASVNDGIAALQEMQKQNRCYDAVLLDWYEPGEHAIDPFNDISAHIDEKTPVILMTNIHARKKLEESETIKPDGILFKPVTSSNLFDALHELLTQDAKTITCAGSTYAGSNGAESATEKHLHGVRILLVEDNEFNQIVARDLLEHLGASLDILDNGEKAVEQMRHNQHQYDIILMDVQMPVMDGFTATTILRKELNIQLPIVAMTAGVTVFERDSCIQSGMNDLIAKPIDVDVMVAIILQHIARETPDTSMPVPNNNNTQINFVENPLHKNGLNDAHEENGIFDIDKLLKIGGDNLAYLTKTVLLIGNLVKNTETNFALTKDEFMLGRYETVAAMLHTLRGSVGVVGAKQLVASALQLEKMIADGEPVPALEFMFQNVENDLKKTLEAAKKWIDGQSIID